MENKKMIEQTEDVAVSLVEQIITCAEQPESYLFLGKGYDRILDKVYAKLCYTKPIDMYSVNDECFSFSRFTNFCTDIQIKSHKGRLVVLRLKNKVNKYQSGLLVPMERLALPLLVFADDDCFMDSVMSRFKAVYKQTNECLQIKPFITPHVALAKPHLGSTFDCPSLIVLEDYNTLSSLNKNTDILISMLSGGSLYPEVLSNALPST